MRSSSGTALAGGEDEIMVCGFQACLVVVKGQERRCRGCRSLRRVDVGLECETQHRLSITEMLMHLNAAKDSMSVSAAVDSEHVGRIPLRASKNMLNVRRYSGIPTARPRIFDARPYALVACTCSSGRQSDSRVGLRHCDAVRRAASRR